MQINSCFLTNLVNRDFNRVPDRITFFTNTTACILARTRCNDINPITGDFQRQVGSPKYPPGVSNGVGTAGYYHYNALQIGTNGDLKIIAFPPTIITGNHFCSHNISLAQSPFGQTCRYL